MVNFRCAGTLRDCLPPPTPTGGPFFCCQRAIAEIGPAARTAFHVLYVLVRHTALMPSLILGGVNSPRTLVIIFNGRLFGINNDRRSPLWQVGAGWCRGALTLHITSADRHWPHVGRQHVVIRVILRHNVEVFIAFAGGRLSKTRCSFPVAIVEHRASKKNLRVNKLIGPSRTPADS